MALQEVHELNEAVFDKFLERQAKVRTFIADRRYAFTFLFTRHALPSSASDAMATLQSFMLMTSRDPVW